MTRYGPICGLKRDIVVEFPDIRRCRRRGALFGRGPCRTGLAAPGRTASPPEHLHLAGDDLGRISVFAFLVLPLASSQAALDVNLRALAQILRGDLSELVVQHDRVPLGPLLLVTGLSVLPGFARRDADIRDGLAA